MAGSINSSYVSGTLTEIEKIQADRSYRDGQGVFFVGGVRNFVQAVDNGLEIVLIVYSERLLTAALARMMVRRLRRAGTTTVRVTPEEFRSISHTRRASGVGAILRQNLCHRLVRMPMTGSADSLNLGVAGSLLMYEIYRARKNKKKEPEQGRQV